VSFIPLSVPFFVSLLALYFSFFVPGYAGGKNTDNSGRVCYHNFSGVADYGKLGHGEVVGMTIPETYIGAFSKEYFDLFSSKGGESFYMFFKYNTITQHYN